MPYTIGGALVLVVAQTAKSWKDAVHTRDVPERGIIKKCQYLDQKT